MSNNVFGSTLKCKLNHASLESKHLECLKNDPIIRSIRQNFLKAESLNKTCPECREAFPDATKSTHLFHQPYMAFKINAQDFGGYWVFVIFKNDSALYRLWLYEIDAGNFELRELKSVEPDDSFKTKMKNFSSDAKYASYWIP